MRENPSFALENLSELKRLVRANPWATLVSNTSTGLVASHYPVMLDESREEISLLTHVGRPDDEVHELGRHELMMIVQGAQGYVSSGWYDEKPAVPTWNFEVAHFSGVPEILSDEENWQVLSLLTRHFEERLPHPRLLNGSPADEAYARRIMSGTIGLRLTPTRVVAKNKMSQNRTPGIVDTIIGELAGEGPYANPPLADEMRRVHGREASSGREKAPGRG